MSIMKYKFFILLLLSSFLLSHELYKEIRVSNDSYSDKSYFASLGVHIDHATITDEYIQFVISDHDIQKLNTSNLSYSIIHENVEEFYQSRLIQDYFYRDFDYGSMGGYYTFAEIEDHLDELSNDYPHIFTEKISIGTSLEGRDIWAIKVSDNPNIDEDEPEALYTGLHHAREPMSYMNLFFFMYWLAENYETDNLATHIVNNRELWIIPAVNPDGLIYNQSIAPNGGGMQRKNARDTCNGTPDGVDLNRNYSYMWGYDNEGSSPDGCGETFRGSGPFSEPETQAISEFVEQHNFPIAMNYHSYSNLLIYPFGYEYENQAPQEDVDIMIEYGQDMVQFNNYELGTGPDLLYPVNGEACDWMYGEHDIFAYTPEIGTQNDGFWPATNRIYPLAEENLYPNQFVAVNVGSKYDVEASINTTEFELGELYPLNIVIMNKGMGSSNGNVYLNINSSDNLMFELDYIELDAFNPREEINLGDITYFQISPGLNGVSLESINVQVYDEDGYVYESIIEIVVGQTELYIDENFANNSGWTVGYPGDLATAGLWERLIPIATYENNEIVQPGEDHSTDDEYCFLTANPTSPNGNPGSNDVDGGKTTLLSPVYNLSEYDGAIVSYWRWFTNNQGNNPGDDFWYVDVTFDGGDSWMPLENTNVANNSWENKQFVLNEFSTVMTDNVQFRFVAEDIYYEGNNGSGGSLVEAAVDDFSIEVYTNDNEILLGDLNFDFAIDVIDVVILVNNIIGETDFNDLEFYAADLNSDQVINVLDVVTLVNLILY